ncbi:MAG: DUF3551 domain-containing protein [Proteobacteria bacterium]|nr:DUF3551 domain-containing protein [Pseudomonadota bacterium]
MRMLQVSVISLSVWLVGPIAVSAQTYDPNYPVCMHVFGEQLGDRMDCIFTSMAQCMASASGLPALCLMNPYYNRGSPSPHRPR